MVDTETKLIRARGWTLPHHFFALWHYNYKAEELTLDGFYELGFSVFKWYLVEIFGMGLAVF